MTVARHASTDNWIEYLGEQVQRVRLQKNVAQTDLASKAGIIVGALKNLEGGKGPSVRTLVKVVRALECTYWLQALAAEIWISPMKILRGKSSRRSKERQRAAARGGPTPA
ncbi:helix-turn-helix transcriptional regulator [Denitromonas sp.]|uniref:helix-turn-helix domain-containing protein n=1 Tax=Denitromonas sp. TaxID=2734609 RepID=UPI002AFE6485|nr:helix-turn-helix transcriptional regulator [Denitromonas sp.]